MPVSTRTEYAIRALLEIANQKGEALSAQKICANQTLPKKYVEHLLGSLKKAGLISSSAGSRGGYVLARPAPEISLREILEAVEDQNLELSCAFDKQYCLGADCGLSRVFAEISQKQRRLLDGYSLETIRKISVRRKK